VFPRNVSGPDRRERFRRADHLGSSNDKWLLRAGYAAAVLRPALKQNQAIVSIAKTNPLPLLERCASEFSLSSPSWLARC
jgi:hypothetical protein